MNASKSLATPKKARILAWGSGAFLLVVACFFFLRNKPDPEWLIAQQLLKTDYLTLDRSTDSIQGLFTTFLHDWPNLTIPDFVVFE